MSDERCRDDPSCSDGGALGGQPAAVALRAAQGARRARARDRDDAVRARCFPRPGSASSCAVTRAASSIRCGSRTARRRSRTLLLAAHALGLGAVWLGFWPEMERVEPLQSTWGCPRASSRCRSSPSGIRPRRSLPSSATTPPTFTTSAGSRCCAPSNLRYASAGRGGEPRRARWRRLRGGAGEIVDVVGPSGSRQDDDAAGPCAAAARRTGHAHARRHDARPISPPPSGARA